MMQIHSGAASMYFIFTIAGIHFVAGNYSVSNTRRRRGGKRGRKGIQCGLNVSYGCFVVVA